MSKRQTALYQLIKVSETKLSLLEGLYQITEGSEKQELVERLKAHQEVDFTTELFIAGHTALDELRRRVTYISYEGSPGETILYTIRIGDQVSKTLITQYQLKHWKILK